jgi:hypothetical protein
MTVSYAYPENIDVYDFCENETMASEERTAVKNAISAAVIANKYGTARPGSHGLAVYFPPRKEVFTSEYSGANIQFAAAAPNWVSFLQGLTPNEEATDDDLEICYTAGYEAYWGNNGPNQAYINGSLRLNVESSIPSYIYSPSDEDWYYIQHDTSITISLTVPSGCDYDLYLLDASTGNTLGASYNSGSTTETITYSAGSGYYYNGYFVVVVGYNSYSRTAMYTLSRSN